MMIKKRLQLKDDMHICVWTVANNYTWTLFYLSFQLPPVASFRYCCHFSFIHHRVSEWECVLCSCSFCFLWIQWHQSVNGCGSGSKQKRKEFARAVNRHGMSKRFKMRSMRERNVQITFVIIFSTSSVLLLPFFLLVVFIFMNLRVLCTLVSANFACVCLLIWHVFWTGKWNLLDAYQHHNEHTNRVLLWFHQVNMCVCVQLYQMSI